MQGTIVITGDEVFRLWKNQAMTQPVISGDGSHILWTKVETKPPLRKINFTRARPIYIENISDTFIRPINPCDDVNIGGAVVGHVSAGLERLGEGEFDRDMRGTCDDEFSRRMMAPGEFMMAPGELWRVHLSLGLNQPLAEGSHFFDIFVGVV